MFQLKTNHATDFCSRLSILHQNGQRRVLSVCCWLLFATLSATAYGQAVSIQQPIVQQFGVGTTVSVPDQGTAHLGSVSSARDFRGRYGPFPSGRSFLTERMQRSVSASVLIHDLEEMDRLLLSRGISDLPLPFEMSEQETARQFPPVTRDAPALRERLPRPQQTGYLTNRLDTEDSGSISRTFPAAAPTPLRDNASLPIGSPVLRTGSGSDRVAETYLRQGDAARQQGNESLARIYYRLAARNGSQAAASR